MQGRITKQISNLYTVQVNDESFECSARGKFRKDKISPVVGDLVNVDILNKTIDEILPRKNKLDRPVVANVDIALIVTSVKKPDLSLNLLDKLLTIIISNNIKPVICLTKLDLLDNGERSSIKKVFSYYKKIGIPVITNTSSFKLKRLLKNKLVVLTGQTGAGKSSLLNRLNKDLNLETNPISEALNRGIHTTRHTEIYKIGKIFFVDTPGFSALDLNKISVEDLQSTFIEFNNYNCPFSNCKHSTEKDCNVIKAVKNKEILESRYDNYLKFLKELNENSSKLFK